VFWQETKQFRRKVGARKKEEQTRNEEKDPRVEDGLEASPERLGSAGLSPPSRPTWPIPGPNRRDLSAMRHPCNTLNFNF
jgi:hypothetical protein